ncbi:hypothetical protein OXPF_30910 [Oxobacter pfennigii]|uniref:Uncharacterized protein n=1 Tax=Oxobacter pfennigii TaxID=36849 RepID=A0A0P8YVC0_9CLOT|nr:hypothetical protein [Oxobacter pfennigii]KPU43649.1 hypothetical protein OXPF_30910 [Oxobacter pfennigii]
MKINADLFSFIEDNSLLELIERNPDLKKYIDDEISRLEDEGIIHNCSCPMRKAKGCSGCSSGKNAGCSSGCSHSNSSNPAYLTALLSSIFNFYIPDDIKNAINLGVTTYIE